MARLFNGSSQYARLATPVNPGTVGAFTIGCWVRPDLTAIADFTQANVVQQMDSGGTGRSILYIARSGSTYYLTSFLGGAGRTGSSINMASFDDKWVHIAVTYDGAGTLKLYVGTGVAGTFTSVSPEATAGDIVLGVAKTLTDSWFKGEIAEVGFWNADIGVRGIGALAGGRPPGAVRPASLLAWLPLYGNASPEPSLRGTPGTHNATLTGSPTQSVHSPTGQIAPRALWLSDYTAVSGSLQTATLPSLGDVATVNGPDVKGRYTLTLPSLGDVATINAPNIFEYEEITLGPIGGGGVIGGLWIENEPEAEPTPTPGEPIPASTTLPDPRVVVYVVDPTDPQTVLETLEHAKVQNWQDVVGDAGTGTVELDNDDPDAAEAVTSYGRLLRFEQDGRQVFLAQIRRREQVVLAQDEEVAEVTTVGGPGILEAWSKGLVYPEAGYGGKPYGDQRLLDWTSADFDDSGWRNAKLGQRIGDVHDVDPNIAKGFPDGDAHVLWAYGSGNTGTPGAGGIPPGLAYLRKSFTVATAGWHRLFVSADDGITVTIDGVPIFGEARLWFHLETKWVDLYLSAGTHQLAVRVENLDNGNLAGNSAWGLLSMFDVDENGNLGSVVVRSDSTWKGVAFPPKPPGMTVGRVIRILLEEAQARGALLGWTLAFDDLTDSAGVAWDGDQALAFQHGMDLYAVLKQLAETYCELDTAPAQLVLYAYVNGYGLETSVEYTEGESILALAHEGTG